MSELLSKKNRKCFGRLLHWPTQIANLDTSLQSQTCNMDFWKKHSITDNILVKSKLMQKPLIKRPKLETQEEPTCKENQAKLVVKWLHSWSTYTYINWFPEFCPEKNLFSVTSSFLLYLDKHSKEMEKLFLKNSEWKTKKTEKRVRNEKKKIIEIM